VPAREAATLPRTHGATGVHGLKVMLQTTHARDLVQCVAAREAAALLHTHGATGVHGPIQMLIIIHETGYAQHAAVPAVKQLYTHFPAGQAMMQELIPDSAQLVQDMFLKIIHGHQVRNMLPADGPIF